MKLRIVLLTGIFALLLAGGLIAQTATELFPYETFDSWTVPATPPTGWARLMGGDEATPADNANDWHPEGVPSGTWDAADLPVAQLYWSPMEIADDWLITPAFDVTGATYDSIIIEFEADYRIWSAGTGDNVVLLSNDGGTTWPETLAFFGPTLLPAPPADTHGVWRIDISSLATSSNVKIGFWYLRDTFDDYWWEVDNVCAYGYEPPTEPEAPVFTLTCEEFIAEGSSEYTAVANVVDLTGVDETSVEICYSLNGAAWTCDPMIFDTPPGSPPGSGDYSYEFEHLKDWDVIEYLVRASDTYSPATMGSSEVCMTTVLGPYYIYEDGTGFPMSPDSSWIDATIGSEFPALAGDDVYGLFSPFLFPVRFWGRTSTQCYISTNGWIQFGGGDPGSDFLFSSPIPTAGAPDPLLAWVWDDLYGNDGEFWYYEDPAGDYFIFAFLNWKQYPSSSPTWNCQVQVWSPDAIPTPGNNSVIDVRFNTLPSDPADIEMGIERWDGLRGTAYLHVGGTYGDPSYLGLTSPSRTIRYCTVPPPAGTMYGYVDLLERADESGAEVGIVGLPLSGTSDATGYYRVYNIPPGTYDAYCTHPAYYADTTYGVVIVEDDSVRVDWTLNPRMIGYVRGYADLTDTPTPDAGINVEALGGGVTDVTDATGAFFLDGVVVGDNQVVGIYPGYDVGYTPIFNLAPGETLDMDTIFLSPVIWDSLTTDDGGAVPDPMAGCWEWGTPTVGPSAANTPPNCWGTVLDGDYIISANCKLDIELPYPCSKFAWYNWLLVEFAYDGGNVKVSKDGGTTWELATPNDTAYNTTADAANAGIPGQECWSSGYRFDEWFYQSINLTPDVTHVRFHFGSDPSFVYEGWYVDDFQYWKIPVGNIEGYVYDCNTFEVLENARVDAPGGFDYTDETGYFFIPDVPYGQVTVTAGKSGYWPNNKEVTVLIDGTVSTIIPICPIGVDSITGWLSHTEEDSITFEICNPTTDTMWFHFSGVPGATGGVRARPVFDRNFEVPARDKSTIVDPYAMRAGEPDESAMPRMRPEMVGDVVDSFDVSLHCDLNWGLGVSDRLSVEYFWVGNIDTYSMSSRTLKFSAMTGAWAGVSWSTTGVGGASWMADMTWDDNHRVMWQVAVAGSNKLYAFDITTGAIVDSIGDPAGIWDNPITAQRGVGYDYATDKIYVGGWVDDMIYEIKGLDWDNPGEVLNTYAAPGCAGIGFDPSRRTVWYSASEAADQIYEIDLYTGDIITTIPAPAAGYLGGFGLNGFECDNEGRLWVSNANTRKIYVLEAPTSALPGGMYVDPPWGYLAPGECITFALINPAYATPVGDYCFDLYFYPTDNATPTVIPTCVQVQPRAPKGWSIISVPVIADPDDPFLQFTDDITPFEADYVSSNIYGWNQDDGIFELPTGFERGRGYYLKTWLDDTYWEVYGAPYAPGDFTYPVYYPEDSPNWGWWVVGNPFTTRVNWDAVYAATDFTYLDPSYWTWSQKYGTGSYNAATGLGFGAGNYIDSWLGYMIYVRSGNPATYTNIVYPQDGTLETFAVKANKTKAVSDDSENPEDFVLRISAEGVLGSDHRTDVYNYIGVDNLALDAFDDYDVREPSIAPPTGQLKSYFDNSGLNLMVDTKANFNGGTKEWTYKVKDLPSGMNVTLSWPRDRVPTPDDASCGVENLDARWNLLLTDVSTGASINMREITSYDFIYTGGTRTFRITLLDEPLDIDEQQLPKEFALSANKPNPFNATTEFTVALPVDSDVTIDVFDILGNKISRLVDGPMDAGYQRIIWNGRDASGRDVPSGIYLYKVNAGDFRETRKMTLIK